MNIMQGRINFYAGEIKIVSAQVKARNPDEIVVVTEAKYQLKDVASGENVEGGELEIEGDTVSTILGIDSTGTYELKFTVRVGAETFIEIAIIQVG